LGCWGEAIRDSKLSPQRGGDRWIKAWEPRLGDVGGKGGRGVVRWLIGRRSGGGGEVEGHSWTMKHLIRENRKYEHE